MQKHKQTHTLTLIMADNRGVEGVCLVKWVGRWRGRGWRGLEGITKQKIHSEEDRWQRGSLVEDRQTLLDTSLALSRVFLEFTDKKHAGGRHHQRVCAWV